MRVEQSRLPLEQLPSLIPDMRACARALCRNSAWADDLVQEALLKAWRHSAQYTPGTDFRGWVFTILRNTFLTSVRQRQREVRDQDGKFALRLTVEPPQVHHVALRDLERYLAALPSSQRVALMMVGPHGYSYEEAAARCKCAVGSVKSRVSRARRALEHQLQGTPDEGASSAENENAG
jgi:RNA polymerase sigma-70 factor, ECF subfamily